MNWYKNHTLYEFKLHNLYNNCMNSFVWIRTKISEKKKKPGWDFNPGPKWLAIVAVSATHHPDPSISGHFIYIPYNKNTIRKSGLYDLTRMAYSQSHTWSCCCVVVCARWGCASGCTTPSICDVRRSRPFSCSPNSWFEGAVCWLPNFLVRRGAPSWRWDCLNFWCEKADLVLDWKNKQKKQSPNRFWDSPNRFG